MDALSEAIARLLRRQDVTDRRLADIEKALGIARAPAPQPEPPPPPRVEVPPPAPVEAPQEVPAVPAAAGYQPAPLETKVGLTWVNRGGAVTLALGVAFFFKYAVDNAWIGPRDRVGLGVLAGLVALGIGDRTWNSGQKTYAQGLSGLGLAILYLSFYSTFGFYHLLEPGYAFVLMAMTTAMAGAFALRYDALAIAALGLLGGYATPLLLSTGEDRPWVLFSWVLVLNLGALAAARLRKWKSLEALAFVATVTLYYEWMAERFAPEKRSVAALFDFVYYGLFAGSEIPFIFYFAQALAPIALPAICKEMVLPYAIGSLALAIAGLAISDWRNHANGSGVTFAAFWLAYAMWSGDFRHPLPAGSVFLFLTAAFLVFLCWILRRIVFRGADFGQREALLLAINGASYFGVCYDL